MALRSRWVSGRQQYYDGDYTAIGGRGIDYGNVNSGALLHGGGTSSSHITYSTGNKNFLSYYVENSSATGTNRGLYMRLYLSGGSGGEAGRFYTTVSNDAPTDTVNGAHISLNFGASAGNITGLGTAARCTFEVPNRSVTGTTAGVMSEFSAGGTSSANGGTMSFLRAVLSGNATGAAAVEDTVNLIEVAGGTNASGNVVGALNGNEPTWTGKTGLIRVNLNGTTAYLVAITL